MDSRKSTRVGWGRRAASQGASSGARHRARRTRPGASRRLSRRLRVGVSFHCACGGGGGESGSAYAYEGLEGTRLDGGAGGAVSWVPSRFACELAGAGRETWGAAAYSHQTSLAPSPSRRSSHSSHSRYSTNSPRSHSFYAPRVLPCSTGRQRHSRCTRHYRRRPLPTSSASQIQIPSRRTSQRRRARSAGRRRADSRLPAASPPRTPRTPREGAAGEEVPCTSP